MGIHVTAINGMGASTISGSTITNTGMKAEDHMHISEDFISTAGVVNQSDCAVTQNGTPNMSVNVASGVAYILNPAWTAASLTETKYWRIKNDATVNVAISANASGNPRITSIFAKLTTGTTPDDYGTNVGSFVAVDGTPAGSPTAPAAPSDGNGYTRLADITVASGASSIVTANIADRRSIVDIANSTGWIPVNESWTYTGADSPTFTFIVPSVDVTWKYQPGQRIRLTQTTGGTKYFIITAVAFATNTTITVYGGTDYTLNNEAIYMPYYSREKAPVGFPLNKAKWRSQVNTTAQTQGSPTQNAWYNNSSNSIVVPIGCWVLGYDVSFGGDRGSSTAFGTEVTISATNSTQDDVTMTSRASVTATFIIGDGSRRKIVNLASKTTYYVNIRTTQTSMSNIYLEGSAGQIYYENAYL